MHETIRYGARALAILLLFVASAPAKPSSIEAPPHAAAAPVQDSTQQKCCFTNTGYAGTCEVTPAKDETCGKILDYLNNPMSQGKDYCNSTATRGGWQSVACAGK